MTAFILVLAGIAALIAAIIVAMRSAAPSPTSESPPPPPELSRDTETRGDHDFRAVPPATGYARANEKAASQLSALGGMSEQTFPQPVPVPAPTPPVARPALRRISGKRIIFVDTETTGVTSYDRVITLAAIRSIDDEVQTKALHLVFDPRRNSHPEAIRVHGWDDWTLRHQDLFADFAPAISDWLSWADLLVMHNVEFDLRMLNRELRKAESPQIASETFCTMERAYSYWPHERGVRLDACLSRIGLARQGKSHGAFEDAWLTMNLYRHMEMSAVPTFISGPWPAPMNFNEVPQRPVGELPRRTTKKRSKTPLATFPQ